MHNVKIRNHFICTHFFFTGKECLPFFLSSSSPSQINGGGKIYPLNGGVMTFDFGLHDFALNDRKAEFAPNLEYIVLELLKLKQEIPHLLYVTATPVPWSVSLNNVLQDLNRQARSIMKKHGIPVLDLYKVVIDYCGPVPYTATTCDITLNTLIAKSGGNPHYNYKGYNLLGTHVAQAIRAML